MVILLYITSTMHIQWEDLLNVGEDIAVTERGETTSIRQRNKYYSFRFIDLFYSENILVSNL
jgi:hypothetical protein